ncbi:serine/arginine repetitive matrix protein 2-like [Cherax quadricarinatus]|uniref:serine/arginine repetitive matrix protein 2-like n=1 Tax=Cherax quadricarinatus TaxID=27406 RepID=UPI00237978D0|nr:serine/arginine repetitive matrix protein 2-like [Cherax quadricarinatus]
MREQQQQQQHRSQLGGYSVMPTQLGRRHAGAMPRVTERRRSRSLSNRQAALKGCRGAPCRADSSESFTSTKNAMKSAMGSNPGSGSKDRASEESHVMGGGRPTPAEEHRRKPKSLPPLEQKPRSPLISASPLERDLSARFIGSPPPSGLRRDDNGNTFEVRRSSMSASESGEEDRVVYQPANPALELSQPRITLHTAPRKGSPPPPHAIVSAESAANLATSSSSLSLRSMTSAAPDNIHQALTPPPKLVSYRAEGGAEAVQEWVPDEDGIGLATPPRKSSSPSIRDLPSPVLGRHGLNRPPPLVQTARRTRSTIKLSPINK